MSHGTVSAYVQGCRCDECRRASRDYQRRRRLEGTQRTAEALARAKDKSYRERLERLMRSAAKPLPPVYIAGKGLVDVEPALRSHDGRA